MKRQKTVDEVEVEAMQGEAIFAIGMNRLNIIVPTDCVSKIDKLKENAGFASRGRTIQEAIDIIWDLHEDIHIVDSIFPMIFETPQKKFIPIIPILFNITKRIGRFGLNSKQDIEKISAEWCQHAKQP